MNLQKLIDHDLLDDEMIKWDDFDDCILGIGSRCGMEDVIEYIDHNITGAYVGERTPIMLEDLI